MLPLPSQRGKGVRSPHARRPSPSSGSRTMEDPTERGLSVRPFRTDRRGVIRGQKAEGRRKRERAEAVLSLVFSPALFQSKLQNASGLAGFVCPGSALRGRVTPYPQRKRGCQNGECPHVKRLACPFAVTYLPSPSRSLNSEKCS